MAQVMRSDDRHMTVVEHLEELRRVLIISLIAFAVPTVVIAVTPPIRMWLLDLLLRPLKDVLGKTNTVIQTAIFTSPTEGLTIPLKIAAFAGLVIAMPVILWQIWTFVAPGLRPAERKFAGPFIASALILFCAGAAFAYLIMPLGLTFLATFMGPDVAYFPDINEYISFLLMLVLIFGVTFELPVAIVLLGMLGIVSSRWLRKRRRAMWIGIMFASLIVTPGADPFTPCALAIPLIILFESSILVLDKAFRR